MDKLNEELQTKVHETQSQEPEVKSAEVKADEAKLLGLKTEETVHAPQEVNNANGIKVEDVSKMSGPDKMAAYMRMAGGVEAPQPGLSDFDRMAQEMNDSVAKNIANQDAHSHENGRVEVSTSFRDGSSSMTSFNPDGTIDRTTTGLDGQSKVEHFDAQGNPVKGIEDASLTKNAHVAEQKSAETNSPALSEREKLEALRQGKTVDQSAMDKSAPQQSRTAQNTTPTPSMQTPQPKGNTYA